MQDRASQYCTDWHDINNKRINSTEFRIRTTGNQMTICYIKAPNTRDDLQYLLYITRTSPKRHTLKPKLFSLRREPNKQYILLRCLETDKN